MLRKRLSLVNSLPSEFWFENVKKTSEVMWKDWYCGRALRISMGLMVITMVLLVWRLPKLPPQVPLFYSRTWGENQLASPWALWWLPGLNLVILGINLLMGGLVFITDKLLARMLMTAATLSVFLMAVAIARIFWLML